MSISSSEDSSSESSCSLACNIGVPRRPTAGLLLGSLFRPVTLASISLAHILGALETVLATMEAGGLNCVSISAVTCPGNGLVGGIATGAAGVVEDEGNRTACTGLTGRTLLVELSKGLTVFTKTGLDPGDGRTTACVLACMLLIGGCVLASVFVAVEASELVAGASVLVTAARTLICVLVLARVLLANVFEAEASVGARELASVFPVGASVGARELASVFPVGASVLVLAKVFSAGASVGELASVLVVANILAKVLYVLASVLVEICVLGRVLVGSWELASVLVSGCVLASVLVAGCVLASVKAT